MNRMLKLNTGNRIIKLYPCTFLFRFFNSTRLAFDAEFKKELRRGTDGIFESPHLRNIPGSYSKKQLVANFYGPRDWHFLTMKSMRKHGSKTPSDIKKLHLALESDNTSHPNRYPFLSKDMVDSNGQVDLNKCNPDIDKQYEDWKEYRHWCATVHPNSPFDREERIIDSWNFLCSKKDSISERPDHIWHGGMKISLRDEYAQYQGDLKPQMEGTTNRAYQMYTQIHKDCNPFQKSHISPNFLEEFVLSALDTPQDVRYLLPEVLRRWRWLGMGGIQPEYSTPSSQITSKIVELCCKFDLSHVALHFIRYKQVYKLYPQIKDFEDLAISLAEKYLKLAASPSNLSIPEAPEPLPEKQNSKRRKENYREFPFRQGPRFYFYKSLPFVLSPEPSVFAEFELPELPKNNETRRLLPDDQRKKLKMMIDEAQKVESWNNLPRESAADQALTDLFKLYHYISSSHPKYYSLEPSPLIHDLLVTSGACGSTDIGLKRSLIAAEEILKDDAPFSVSGLSGYLLSLTQSENLPKELFSHEDTFEKYLVNSRGADQLGFGSLSGFLMAKQCKDSEKLAAKFLERTFAEDSKSSARVKSAFMHEKMLSLAAPHVAKSLEKLKAFNADLYSTIRQKLINSTQLGKLCQDPQVKEIIE